MHCGPCNATHHYVYMFSLHATTSMHLHACDSVFTTSCPSKHAGLPLNRAPATACHQELEDTASQLGQLRSQHAALEAKYQACIGELQRAQQRCLELKGSEGGLVGQLQDAQAQLARFQARLQEIQVGGEGGVQGALMLSAGASKLKLMPGDVDESSTHGMLYAGVLCH